MTNILAVITLTLIVLALLVERYFYTKQMTGKLSEAMKAVMSRNINEFITATQADKAPKQDFIKDEYVPLDEANDEEFDKMIDKQNI